MPTVPDKKKLAMDAIRSYPLDKTLLQGFYVGQKAGSGEFLLEIAQTSGEGMIESGKLMEHGKMYDRIETTLHGLAGNAIETGADLTGEDKKAAVKFLEEEKKRYEAIIDVLTQAAETLADSGRKEKAGRVLADYPVEASLLEAIVTRDESDVHRVMGRLELMDQTMVKRDLFLREGKMFERIEATLHTLAGQAGEMGDRRVLTPGERLEAAKFLQKKAREFDPLIVALKA